MTNCICKKSPGRCQCDKLPPYQEMLRLRLTHGNLKAMAREKQVSRETIRTWLMYHGLMRERGQPSKSDVSELERERNVNAQRLRQLAGWPSLEGWESNL